MFDMVGFPFFEIYKGSVAKKNQAVIHRHRKDTKEKRETKLAIGLLKSKGAVFGVLLHL